MYREWLAKKLENAPRGTKARLAEHMRWNADIVSKTLSGIREISAEELPQIAFFFGEMPPGFDGLQAKAHTDEEITRILLGIDVIGEGEANVVLSFIRNLPDFLGAKSSPPADHDQRTATSPHRERVPSR